MNNKSLAAILMSMIAVSLAACGGGGGDDDEEEDAGPPDASGAGLWAGSIRIDGTTTNLPFQGIVTEEGDFALIGLSPSGTRQFFGTGSTNGNAFSANAVTYLNFVRSVPASMQGTIADGASINGSYAFTGESATFNLSYQRALYERPASLAILQGSYSATHQPTGTEVSAVIEANGTLMINYSQPVGCVLSGTVTVPHSDRNYYRVTGTYNAACSPRTGPMRAIIFLIDAAPGQNNQFLILGQLDAQTFSEYIPPKK